MSIPFTARYHGKCVTCGDPIRPGDRVHFPEDGTSLEHVECDAATAPETLTGDVCPKCWLTRSLSGECGCDQ